MEREERDWWGITTKIAQDATLGTTCEAWIHLLERKFRETSLTNSIKIEL